ncbi:MAG: aminopeptidase [Thermoplasmatota archaeon]
MPVSKEKKKVVRKARKDPHSWIRRWSAQEMKGSPDIERISKRYMRSLDRGRTEREAVVYWKEIFDSAGYVDISNIPDSPPVEGQGFYLINRGKQMMVGVVGKAPIRDGLNIIATHLDSPRLDLKPRPVDGDPDTGLGLLRTHYYGGIKKYHWVNIPLSLHGVIVKESGEIVNVRIGDRKNDPVFVIPDLLPHLYGKTQGKRKLQDGILGEELVALTGTGSIPDDADDKPSIVMDILRTLRRRYGVIEEDLISSELCLIPSWKPRELGLDRGMIAAYGQDNKVSCFCANEAILGITAAEKIPARWSMTLHFDKEEIGSDGSTGAKSEFLELALYRLLEWTGARGRRSEMNRTLSSSFAVSLDVKSGVNPIFKGVQDSHNSARLGAGITITKYTGKGGKSAANDASAEMVSAIRRLYNREGIVWQMQETGKVDQGGGGTVAKFLASRNMDVIDNGVPLLSMHSPYEVSSKSDIAMTVKAMSVFMEKFS